MGKLKQSAIVVVSAFALFWFYENTVNKPFSFVHITYLEKEENFNAPPKLLNAEHGLNVTLPLAEKTYDDMRQLLEQHSRPKAERTGFENNMATITRTVRHLIANNTGGDLRSEDEDFLSTDPRFKHICSEAAKLTVAYAQALGYNGRVIWMDGHTVSEIYNPDQGWVLVDSYGNVMFYDDEGPAALLDIVSHYEQYEPKTIVTPRYPQNTDYLSSGYLDQESHVFNDQWLFVTLDGEDTLSIHQTSRDLAAITQSVFEVAPQAVGMQFVGFGDEKVGNVGLGLHRRLLHGE